jgi:hypothetical protein
MPNHKLTLLGQPASTKIQIYLQNSELHGTERRLAYADHVIAISGKDGIDLASKLYHVDLKAEGLVERFNAMIQGYGFKKVEKRNADVCAEAHLWMTLVGLYSRGAQQRHPHPRHLHIWVYEIDSHNRPKEDSPCHNCLQWVRREFRTVNGTA